MRTAAMVLGALGGLAGSMFGAGVAILAGFVYQSDLFVGFGIAAAVMGLAAMVGGAIAENHKLAASVLLLVPGLLGFICLNVFWVVPGLLLLSGGVLEVAGGSRNPAGVA
jgi:hypothetical protein